MSGSQTQTQVTQLTPAEKMALTAALWRARRGEEPLANTATLCILALARITGMYDYTKEPDKDPPQKVAPFRDNYGTKDHPCSVPPPIGPQPSHESATPGVWPNSAEPLGDDWEAI